MSEEFSCSVDHADDRELKLSRPLAVIDVQSTGLDPRTARIVKLSVLRIDSVGGEHVRSVIVNPEISIPAASTEVHGLTDLDVAGKPIFRAYARALDQHLSGCDIAGFGIERFGLPLLCAEFERCGIKFELSNRAVVDAMVVFHRLEPRNFNAAYTRFVGGSRKESNDPGQTARDVLEILRGQIRAGSSVPESPYSIEKWSKGIDARAIDVQGKFVWGKEKEAMINFGKYRGHSLREIANNDAAYLNWVAAEDKFQTDARTIAELAVNGQFPEVESGD